jgi:hypothetical protein
VNVLEKTRSRKMCKWLRGLSARQRTVLIQAFFCGIRTPSVTLYLATVMFWSEYSCYDVESSSHDLRTRVMKHVFGLRNVIRRIARILASRCRAFVLESLDQTEKQYRTMQTVLVQRGTDSASTSRLVYQPTLTSFDDSQTNLAVASPYSRFYSDDYPFRTGSVVQPQFSRRSKLR